MRFTKPLWRWRGDALERLRGRRAVVTGASSGIGAAYARRLHAAGLDVVLVARRERRLQALAAELRFQASSGSALPLVADLATDAGVEAVKEEIAAAPVAALVNSAGFGTRGLFGEIDEERTLAMIRLHVESSVRLVRACLPAMVASGCGAVVNVSSLAAFHTTSHYVTYSATKSFLNTFTLGLRDELAGSEVHLQALCPGLTKTEFLETPEYADFDYSQVPRHFWMTAEQVVDESVAALGAGPVVFVPGRANRAFVSAMSSPLGGPLRAAIAAASRRGEGLF